MVAGLELTKTTRYPLFPERFASLRPGIVELAGLSDHNRPGADDQDTLNV